MSIKIFLILLFLTQTQNILGQDSTGSKTFKSKLADEPRKPNIGYPKYYPYAGLGIVQGQRLGAIVQLHENFSAEASFGYILGTGWSLTNPDYMASVGGSLHFRNDVPIFISLIYALRIENSLNHSSHRTENYYSLNIGYLDLTEIGVQFMGRAGFYYSPDDRQRGNIFNYLNIDIGLGYSF